MEAPRTTAEGERRSTAEEAWFVTRRWQAFDGEHRAVHLRVVGVVLFFAVHLLQQYRPLGVFDEASVAGRGFHLAVTVITAGWLSMALAIEVVLRQRWFPKWIAYATTGTDLISRPNRRGSPSCWWSVWSA